MAKNTFTDWDIVAANNTDVGGISILGSSPVSNFDGATRTVMAQLKAGAAAKADPPVDVASAATTDIGAATSWNVRITGTTTITNFGTAAAGTIRFVRFAASLTLTYNATSMLLPGAASIVTQAGDTAFFISEGSGNWRCHNYMAADTSPTTIWKDSDANARLAATQTFGAVGSYAYLAHGSANTPIGQGASYSGSLLRYAGFSGDTAANSVTAPSGSWQAIGVAGAAVGLNSSTLFRRTA